MKKIEVSAGEDIAEACKRLAAAAPAFMVFNDVRVEAAPGEAASDLCGRWHEEMARRKREYQASDLYKQREAESARRRVEEARVRDEALSTVAASGVREKFPWADEMGEISGFGGGYEAACRDMVYAGLAWLETRPKADLSAHTTDAAKALDKVVAAACPDCSGAMHGAAMSAVAFVARQGWPEYVARMTERASEKGSKE